MKRMPSNREVDKMLEDITSTWRKPKYIETPLKIYHGNYNKVVYPYILVTVLVGTFLGAFFLI